MGQFIPFGKFRTSDRKATKGKKICPDCRRPHMKQGAYCQRYDCVTVKLSLNHVKYENWLKPAKPQPVYGKDWNCWSCLQSTASGAVSLTVQQEAKPIHTPDMCTAWKRAWITIKVID